MEAPLIEKKRRERESMAIASLFGVVALPIILIGVLLPVALVVALQVWLCKRKTAGWG